MLYRKSCKVFPLGFKLLLRKTVESFCSKFSGYLMVRIRNKMWDEVS